MVKVSTHAAEHVVLVEDSALLLVLLGTVTVSMRYVLGARVAVQQHESSSKVTLLGYVSLGGLSIPTRAHLVLQRKTS